MAEQSSDTALDSTVSLQAHATCIRPIRPISPISSARSRSTVLNFLGSRGTQRLITPGRLTALSSDPPFENVRFLVYSQPMSEKGHDALDRAGQRSKVKTNTARHFVSKFYLREWADRIARRSERIC